MSLRTRFALPLLVMLVLLDTATAGTLYSFSFKAPGPFGVDESGRAWVGDGSQGRLEWVDTTMVAHQQGRIEIWRDGGREHFVVNAKDKTYYEQNRYDASGDHDPEALSSLDALRLPPVLQGSPQIGHVSVVVNVEGTVTVAGKDCQIVVADVSYHIALKVGRDKVAADVKAKASYWITDALDPVILPFEHGKVRLRTGYEEIDRAIASKLDAFKGIALKRTVSATRVFDGSEPTTDEATFEITSLADAPVPDDMFEVPAGFKYTEPVTSKAKMLSR